MVRTNIFAWYAKTSKSHTLAVSIKLLSSRKDQKGSICIRQQEEFFLYSLSIQCQREYIWINDLICNMAGCRTLNQEWAISEVSLIFLATDSTLPLLPNLQIFPGMISSQQFYLGGAQQNHSPQQLLGM